MSDPKVTTIALCLCMKYPKYARYVWDEVHRLSVESFKFEQQMRNMVEIINNSRSEIIEDD